MLDCVPLMLSAVHADRTKPAREQRYNATDMRTGALVGTHLTIDAVEDLSRELNERAQGLVHMGRS